MAKASISVEQRIDQARRAYLDSGPSAEAVLPGMILRSWERSRDFGLEIGDSRLLDSYAVVGGSTLAERNRLLLDCGLPEMQALQRSLDAAGWIVALVDAEGVVVRFVSGTNSSFRELEQIFAVGRDLSEAAVGTCSPGCALAEGAPAVIRGGEHFLEECRRFICAAIPLFGPQGEIVGALNVTRQFSGDPDTVLEPLALAGRAVENRMLAAMNGALTMRLHSRPEMLGTALEGLLVFAEDGSLLGANQAARRLLSIPRAQGRPMTFGELFDGPANAFSGALSGSGDLQSMCGRAGVAVSARFETRRRRACTAGRPLQPADSPYGEDSRLAEAVWMAHRGFARDIPVLVSGETGTGKEVLARSLHEQGPRRDGSFVAINCSAIPAGLIESELFGYEDGAFTGGRRGGAKGKLEQARGGTLFLDEIGDMPLELQGRLLRVLQERNFTRVGGSKLISLDAAVVSATHRNLKSLVQSGEFREDLYYRIKGIEVTLPPLRTRQDLVQMVKRILVRESGGDALAISQAALAALVAYSWPGNIRQLEHVLRLAITLAEGESCIDLLHLPDEIQEAYEATGMREASEDFECVESASLQRWELERIKIVLHQCRGNISATARKLGIARATLYRKLKMLDALPADKP